MGLALFMEASGALSMGWRCRAPSREGLRSPGRKVNSESLCTPGDQPEKERERERERESKTRGPKLWWSRGVLFNIVWVFILSYKAPIFSRDKIKTYKLSRKHEVIHMKESVVNNHFYHMVHKKEEGTYHHVERLRKEMPGFLSPLERLASPLNSWIFRN